VTLVIVIGYFYKLKKEEREQFKNKLIVDEKINSSNINATL